MTRPLYGKVGSMGFDGRQNGSGVYVFCPWDDNPQLDDQKNELGTWLGAIVEIKLIRPGVAPGVPKKAKVSRA
jgi:hypothetical protein